MSSDPRGTVTRLLHEWQHGDEGVADRLMPLIYDELLGLARSYLRSERSDHTLEPAALVHEVFLRLVEQHSVTWQSRAHFFGIAARQMRRILVDHARRQHAVKRGGGQARVTLDDDAQVADDPTLDLLAVDEALTRLAALDERQARVVELRYFAGLEIQETAEALGISPATVKREWQVAKAWLARELGEAADRRTPGAMHERGPA